MKPLATLAVIAILSSCSATAGPEIRPMDFGDNIEPIRGSITYGGQPKTKLTKSPVGSSFGHQFYNGNGDRVVERYVIQPDRSLRIVSRRIINLPAYID